MTLCSRLHDERGAPTRAALGLHASTFMHEAIAAHVSMMHKIAHGAYPQSPAEWRVVTWHVAVLLAAVADRSWSHQKGGSAVLSAWRAQNVVHNFDVADLYAKVGR